MASRFHCELRGEAMKVGTVSPAFATALVGVQSEIEGAVKGKKNPGFQNSKYADLSACWEACREALHKYEIAVLQFPSVAPPGYVGLESTFLYGPTGETLSEVFTCPIKDSSNPQALGSALTYSRRYALCSMVGICPVDDDGNAAAAPAKVATKVAAPTNPTQVSSETVLRFSKLTDRDAMKAMYTELKNSSVAEPAKTEVLTVWAKKIKETK